MDKFSGPEDIFNELVEQSKDSWLLGLVAFALIEEQRIEWMKHQKEYNKKLPTSDEVKNWYEQQPEGVLLRAKDDAEARLKDYSNETLNAIIEDQRKEVEQGIIVSELREIKKFWPQFGVNLAGGFVSALLFAIALTIIAFFVINDTSPSKIGFKLREQVEVNND
ncbi:MAG: hypothetical protein B6I26_02575 [Desulfobacteraceae bacterium 4572_130]|nr:MAG: hypothetical protein B6I26_02575 [Desulfobacteraceae bacterium 4572_130]